MASGQARLSETDRANLVAYLDGELDEAHRRALESRIQQSVSGRHEVESLRKTWELLDFLVLPKAPEDFTAQTITRIQSVATLDDRLIGVAGRTLPSLARLGVTALVMAAALAVGYASVRWLWPDRTARLARDLSLAEHLDEYRAVGTFDFLRELDESHEFGRMSVSH